LVADDLVDEQLNKSQQEIRRHDCLFGHPSLKDAISAPHRIDQRLFRVDASGPNRVVADAEAIDALVAPTTWRRLEALLLDRGFDPDTIGETLSPLTTAQSLAEWQNYTGIDELLGKPVADETRRYFLPQISRYLQTMRPPSEGFKTMIRPEVLFHPDGAQIVDELRPHARTKNQ